MQVDGTKDGSERVGADRGCLAGLDVRRIVVGRPSPRRGARNHQGPLPLPLLLSLPLSPPLPCRHPAVRQQLPAHPRLRDEELLATHGKDLNECCSAWPCS